MGRWTWVVLVGWVALSACGGEGPGTSQEPPTPSPGGTLQPGSPDASTPDDGGEPSDPSRPDAGGDGETPVDGGSAPDAGTPLPYAGLPDVSGLAPGEFPAVQPRIPTVSLKVAAADLQKLDSNPYSDAMVPVELEIDGRRAKGLMRYRGASTRDLPQKSYKIELDAGYTLEGRDHFHLLASYYDSGKLSEKFAVDLFAALGLPAPRARYVTVRLNGTHKGVFLDMEHVGKEFVKAHGLEGGSARYRCGHRNCELTLTPGSYQTDFEKKNDEEDGRADLDAFLLWVNRSDDAVFEEKLARHVDVEAYLGNLAADALISNAVVEDSRSYWIHGLKSDRWTYVPWDLNNARLLFWRTWSANDPPITNQSPQAFSLYDPFVQTMWEARQQRPTWNVLNSRIWDRPALRARLIAKLEAALNGPFTEAKANAHIDALWKRLGPELAKDPYVSTAHMSKAVTFLKQYVRARRSHLQRTLAQLKAHGGGPLVIREVAAGGTGYVELYNRGTEALDLGRYAVTNDLRSPHLYRLPAGLVLEPSQSLRLMADGSVEPGHLPFLLSEAGGEVGVFDATRMSTSKTPKPLMYGPEDALWFGPLSADTVYGRTTPDSEDFERRPYVRPEAEPLPLP